MVCENPSTRVARTTGFLCVTTRVLPVLAVALLLGVAAPADAQIRRALLSVEGLNIPAGQSIRRFRIDTWGVEFLAVCHVPPSWELKSEKFEDPEGYLSGRAGVHGEPMRRLGEMYLVDVYSYQPLRKGDPKGEHHPASFSGWVEIGTERPFAEGKRHRRTLTAANFRLKDAQLCPASPPAQP